jgi:multicomponent Na+:H+ antiporter subunit G
VSEVLVWVLLAFGVTLQLLAVVGVLVAGDVYDRLHFTGPASIFTPVALALAVVIDEGPVSQAGLKSLLVAVLLMALSPILVHATARAARIRERGGLDIVADEAGVEQ